MVALRAKIKRDRLSLLAGKNIFFNELKEGDNLLLFYEQGVDIYHIFHFLIKNGLDNGDTCLYAFNNKTNRLYFDGYKRNSLFLFPFGSYRGNGYMSRLKRKFIKVSNLAVSKGHILRTIIDWGGIKNSAEKEGAIDCITNIGQIQRLRLRGRLFQQKNEQDFITINAFDMEYLDSETIKSLLNLHKKVIIATRKHSLASFPSVGQTSDFDLSNSFDFDSIPENVMEQVIKKNLEMIVLHLLKQKGICGYDIIKTIAKRFHIVLSQGTLYPLLYSLKEKCLLKCNGNSRQKIYTFTRKGRKYVNNKLNNFIKANQGLLSLFSKPKPKSKQNTLTKFFCMENEKDTFNSNF